MPDKNTIKGKVEEGTGAAQGTAGRATGNRDLEAKGSAQKTEGKAHGVAGKTLSAVGGAPHSVKQAVGG